MAKGINKVILIGNLGADVDVKYNESGSAMATTRIACSEAWKDKNTGEKRENTEWISLVAYGALADVMAKYLHKGSKLYVEGKLQTRDYVQDGVKKYMTQVVVRELNMLDSRGEGQQHDPSGNRQPAPQQSQSRAQPDDFDDDIPF